MSTGSAADHDRETEVEIYLTYDGNWWVAREEETGVASQGRTRTAALENLDEALAGYRGEGVPPTEEDLRELGIDPERNTSGSLDDSEIFE